MTTHNVMFEIDEANVATASARAFKTANGYVFGWGATVGSIATGAVENWAPGAIFIDTDAAQGSQVFVNTGTATTAIWTEIADAGVAGGFVMTSGLADFSGIADVIVLDDDGDTTISAPTDDQIDIEVGGSDVVVVYANGIQDHGNEARTVTTGGATTGLITQGTKFVTVTSDSADKQLSLPAATIGDIIHIFTPATGCELISAVAAATVNDVTVGATNELALVADSTFICHYIKADTWIVRGFTDKGADIAALVPDSL